MATPEIRFTHTGRKVIELCQRAGVSVHDLKLFFDENDQEADQLDRMVISPDALREMVGQTHQEAFARRMARAIRDVYYLDNPQAQNYQPDRILRGIRREINEAIEQDILPHAA